MKMFKIHAKCIVMYCVVLILVPGCASENTVRRDRYIWPLPPNAPRIEWLHSYKSQHDLKITTLRRIKEAVVGQDAQVSLKKPVEVRADAVQGKIYVADLDVGGVYVFDLLNSESRILSMTGSGLPVKTSPISMAIDADRNLYVLEPRHQKILVFGPSEKYIRSIDLEEFCRRPIAIAIDKKKGRLYVSDARLNKIFALDLDGTQLFGFGAPGDDHGAFNMAVGLSIASNGDVIVADSFNARIQIFNSSGSFVRTFGGRGDAAGDFQLIKSVAVDKDDNIYVVDGRSNSVVIFNQAGDLLMTFGGYFSVGTSGKLAPGGFSLPMGIDIDDLGRIYIADQLNSRIQVFQYLADQSGLSRFDSH